LKDAHQEYVTRLHNYRTRFEDLSKKAEEAQDFREARLSTECAVKLTDHIITVESMLADDEEALAVIVPAKEPNGDLS